MLQSIAVNQEIHFNDFRYLVSPEGAKVISNGISNGAGATKISLTAMIGEGRFGYDYTEVHFDLSLAEVIAEGTAHPLDVIVGRSTVVI